MNLLHVPSDGSGKIRDLEVPWKNEFNLINHDLKNTKKYVLAINHHLSTHFFRKFKGNSDFGLPDPSLDNLMY